MLPLWAVTICGVMTSPMPVPFSCWSQKAQGIDVKSDAPYLYQWRRLKNTILGSRGLAVYFPTVRHGLRAAFLTKLSKSLFDLVYIDGKGGQVRRYECLSGRVSRASAAQRLPNCHTQGADL